MSQERPNVICIVADDLGWRDLGCYGSPFYETPNIDALASEGTRFTDAYAAAPVCSPTRASVMSGRYPATIGVTDWIDFGGDTHPARGKLVDASYSDCLPTDGTSLANRMAAERYSTWHVGKWHLGGEKQNSLPEDHGFDINIGGCDWGSPQEGYFGPWNLPTLEEGPEDEGRYLPNRLGEEAVTLIEDHADADTPFFLNYNPYLVHTPLQAPDVDVERYERKREALGLDATKEIEIGDRFPTEHKKDQRIKRRLVQSHPTYAAMVETLDRNVGRILETLDRIGIADDTIIIFTSDNGGLATAEGSPTTNHPLSEGKGWMEEGGNRVPFIVRWPGVTDRPNAPNLSTEPIISPDIYPTALSAAGAEVANEQDIDGENLQPLLEDSNEDLDRRAIFWHYPHYGNQGGTPANAIRVGNWKLLEYFEDDHVELYHLGEDVRENRDLSQYCPEKADELRDHLNEWRESVGARLPEENPDYEPWDDRAGTH